VEEEEEEGGGGAGGSERWLVRISARMRTRRCPRFASAPRKHSVARYAWC